MSFDKEDLIKGVQSLLGTTMNRQIQNDDSSFQLISPFDSREDGSDEKTRKYKFHEDQFKKLLSDPMERFGEDMEVAIISIGNQSNENFYIISNQFSWKIQNWKILLTKYYLSIFGNEV